MPFHFNTRRKSCNKMSKWHFCICTVQYKLVPYRSFQCDPFFWYWNDFSLIFCILLDIQYLISLFFFSSALVYSSWSNQCNFHTPINFTAQTSNGFTSFEDLICMFTEFFERLSFQIWQNIFFLTRAWLVPVSWLDCSWCSGWPANVIFSVSDKRQLSVSLLNTCW